MYTNLREGFFFLGFCIHDMIARLLAFLNVMIFFYSEFQLFNEDLNELEI